MSKKQQSYITCLFSNSSRYFSKIPKYYNFLNIEITCLNFKTKGSNLKTSAKENRNNRIFVCFLIYFGLIKIFQWRTYSVVRTPAYTLEKDNQLYFTYPFLAKIYLGYLGLPIHSSLVESPPGDPRRPLVLVEKCKVKFSLYPRGTPYFSR